MPINQLCGRIAAIIGDYRAGEVPTPDTAHVRRWIDQFPGDVQEPLLRETEHVLSRSYVTNATMIGFLTAQLTNPTLVGNDPVAFWRGVRFLHLQQVGHSQADMLALFDTALHAAFGLRVADCGAEPERFLYLDDCVFSGGRVGSDLVRWINEQAPRDATVVVLTVAVHTLGEYFAGKDIAAAANAAGKAIDIEWWRTVIIEDRKTYMSRSDVLRPSAIPAVVVPYVATLGADPVLRTGNATGGLGLFSSPNGRDLIEQEFLKGGVRVRARCPYFDQYMRPLGRTLMRTTGFGTMFVTYRNIANNAPLVLWAGDPWYPLFPRRTN